MAPHPEPPPAACAHAVLRFRRKPQPHLPQELTPGEPETVASSHPHEMLDRGALELGRGTAHEVADAHVRPASLALDHDRRRRLLAPVSDEPEPHSHSSRIPHPASRISLYHAPHVARVHVGEPDLDPVPLGVASQDVERVEPHRLVVEEGAIIFGGVIVRSEEHTSELQSPCNFVCRLLLANNKQLYLD